MIPRFGPHVAPAPIVGGQDASVAKYPFAAKLHAYDPSQYYSGSFCTASIVSSRDVLTAAHCLTGFDELWVAVGSSALWTSTLDSECSEVIKAQTIALHPNYTSGTHYDVGILTLERSPSCFGGANVSSIALDAGSYWPDELAPTRGNSIGWGSIEYRNGPGPEMLQEVGIDLYNRTDCASYFDLSSMTASHSCAGRMADAPDVMRLCSGDSGGPLFVQEHDKFVEVGISSFSYANCSIPGPSGFERPYFHRDWLDSVALEQLVWASNPPPPLPPPPAASEPGEPRLPPPAPHEPSSSPSPPATPPPTPPPTLPPPSPPSPRPPTDQAPSTPPSPPPEEAVDVVIIASGAAAGLLVLGAAGWLLSRMLSAPVAKASKSPVAVASIPLLGV